MNGLVETALELSAVIDRGVQEREKRPNFPVCDVVICPPFTALFPVYQAHTGSTLKLGGQDMAVEVTGAHTGEISGIMLRNVGCRFVILGHSERRALYGECCEAVGRKTASAYRDGLIPIACLGEDLTQREQEETLIIIGKQLDAIMNAVPDDPAKQQQLVIAYEPVWAIGTGRTATSEQIQEVHRFLRTRLSERLGESVADKVRILYGGSVKPSNAEEILQLDDVDGVLVGGASLNPQEFLTIIDALPAE